ncbi:hypothetical protein RND71_001038 [Anisodus tanguticus]|uniref:Uncharacterized protein n=1 Tax=Anisodus tanguticus TaxID=243964 RepID=A0AAE1T269_9SOLA|nr:hypothetical protein RND71_001038 [Anisodus tanguticus]
MESHNISCSNTLDDVVSKLPLQLIKSEIIPPAPNRSNEPAIDWQPNFAGYSWIAYGASSLLVIRQFPNPLSQTETAIGSVFQQILELSIDGFRRRLVSRYAFLWRPCRRTR